MDNSIYITLSRELALFRDLEITANNIANANTTGYGAERIQFASYLTKDNNQGDRNEMALAHDISSYRDLTNGSMKVTGNELDVAIQGSGYFVVETPLGNRYTRAGNFQLDATGTLVTPEGYPVLDNSSQHLQFPEDTLSVEIGSLGNIKVNGEDFGTLGIVTFENEQMLDRVSGNLYNSELTPEFTENVRVSQGTLENSNVQPVMELTHLITVSRAVGNTAKFIETIYDLERKAANTWAKQG